jgi:cobalamin biosynthesis protein CobD/CbiB
MVLKRDKVKKVSETVGLIMTIVMLFSMIACMIFSAISDMSNTEDVILWVLLSWVTFYILFAFTSLALIFFAKE